MKNNKNLIRYSVYIVLGILLWALGIAEIVDEFWSGMGTSLLIIGVIFLIRNIKYKTNEEYREKIDIETNDERNKYISLKAWAWAGYLFVMLGAVGTIAFKLMGKEDLMMMASLSVCLIMVFYWLSYIFLKKKY